MSRRSTGRRGALNSWALPSRILLSVALFAVSPRAASQLACIATARPDLHPCPCSRADWRRRAGAQSRVRRLCCGRGPPRGAAAGGQACGGRPGVRRLCRRRRRLRRPPRGGPPAARHLLRGAPGHHQGGGQVAHDAPPHRGRHHDRRQPRPHAASHAARPVRRLGRPRQRVRLPDAAVLQGRRERGGGGRPQGRAGGAAWRARGGRRVRDGHRAGLGAAPPRPGLGLPLQHHAQPGARAGQVGAASGRRCDLRRAGRLSRRRRFVPSRPRP